MQSIRSMHKVTGNGKYPISCRSDAPQKGEMLGCHLSKGSMKGLCELGQGGQQEVSPLRVGRKEDPEKGSPSEESQYWLSKTTRWKPCQHWASGAPLPLFTLPNRTQLHKGTLSWDRWPPPLLSSIRPSQLWHFIPLASVWVWSGTCLKSSQWKVRNSVGSS